MWRSYPFDRLSAPPDIFIWYSEIEECSKAKERRNKRREKRRRVIHSVCEKTGLRTGSYQQSSSFPLVTAHTQTRTHTLTHSSCREDSGKGTQSLIRLGWLSHRQKVNILIASVSLSPRLLTNTHTLAQPPPLLSITLMLYTTSWPLVGQWCNGGGSNFLRIHLAKCS